MAGASSPSPRSLIDLAAAGLVHELRSPLQYVGDGLDFAREAIAGLVAVVAAYQRHHAALPAAAAAEVATVAAAVDLEFALREVGPALAACADGVEHLGRLLHGIRDLAHPGGELGPVDVGEVVHRALTLTRRQVVASAELVVSLAPELPPVRGAALDLERVVINLVINAAQAVAATGRRGHIAVATARAPAGVVITVADTGGGIPAAIRDRVFEPFVTTKPVGQGCGLGLALARAVVVGQHRGTLTFTCDDAGTTFVVTLPA